MATLPPLAAIEYLGMDGVTRPCLHALQELLMSGRRLGKAKVITNKGNHGLLFTVDDSYIMAVKAGFSSGYGGEGPRGFYQALLLFEAFDVPVDEYEVSDALFQRLATAQLTEADLEELEGRPTRPGGPSRYTMFGKNGPDNPPWGPWFDAPLFLPVPLLDERLHDLVPTFWSDPDGALLKAFRRLENRVRDRSGLSLTGGTLFSAAFRQPDSPLQWPGLSEGELQGRVNLFAGAYAAFRNPHMHNERERSHHVQWSELLVVNQLFLLEREAVERAPST